MKRKKNLSHDQGPRKKKRKLRIDVENSNVMRQISPLELLRDPAINEDFQKFVKGTTDLPDEQDNNEKILTPSIEDNLDMANYLETKLGESSNKYKNLYKAQTLEIENMKTGMKTIIRSFESRIEELLSEIKRLKKEKEEKNN